MGLEEQGAVLMHLTLHKIIAAITWEENINGNRTGVKLAKRELEQEEPNKVISRVGESGSRTETSAVERESIV